MPAPALIRDAVFCVDDFADAPTVFSEKAGRSRNPNRSGSAAPIGPCFRLRLMVVHALSAAGVAVDADVLIVDDSLVMVNTLRSILSSQGCRVEACHDGEAGWQHLLAGASGRIPLPDVLLLDLNMPRMDGLTLLGRIREKEQLACLPVIVITAETDLDTRSEALGAGADDYLFKPVELTDLLRRVETWSTR